MIGVAHRTCRVVVNLFVCVCLGWLLWLVVWLVVWLAVWLAVWFGVWLGTWLGGAFEIVQFEGTV